MSKVFIFLALMILMLSVGATMVISPEFNTINTNQNELIDDTKWVMDNRNNTDLVISNETSLLPEISIPYVGGIINTILYPIEITKDIISLLFSYITALLGLTVYIPIELAPFVLIGILAIVFMILSFVIGIFKGII